jgi:predicted ribosomally synthesized six-cysteine peptide SCIFF
MKHVKTVNRAVFKESLPNGGCGECRASCQSACKTSCTVANQKCERPQAAVSAVLASIKASAASPLA